MHLFCNVYDTLPSIFALSHSVLCSDPIQMPYSFVPPFTMRQSGAQRRTSVVNSVLYNFNDRQQNMCINFVQYKTAKG